MAASQEPGTDPVCVWSSEDNGATWTVEDPLYIPSMESLSSFGAAVAINDSEAVVAWVSDLNEASQVWVVSTDDGGATWSSPDSWQINTTMFSAPQVVPVPGGFILALDGQGYQIDPEHPALVNPLGNIGSGELLGDVATGAYLFAGDTLQSLGRPGKPVIAIPSGENITYGQGDSGALSLAPDGSLNLVETVSDLSQVQCWSVRWPSVAQTCDVPIIDRVGMGWANIGQAGVIVAGATGWSVLSGRESCTPGFDVACPSAGIWVINYRSPGPLPSGLYYGGAIALALGMLFVALAVWARHRHKAEGPTEPDVGSAPVNADEALIASYRSSLLVWAVCWAPLAILALATPWSPASSEITQLLALTFMGGLAFSFALTHRVWNGSRRLPQFRAAMVARRFSWVLGVVSALVIVSYLLSDYDDPAYIEAVGAIWVSFIASRFFTHWLLGLGTLDSSSMASDGSLIPHPRSVLACLTVGCVAMQFNPITTCLLGVALAGGSTSPWLLFLFIGLFPMCAGLLMVSWAWSRFRRPGGDDTEKAVIPAAGQLADH
jgi:hypothetical protein